MIFFLDIDGVMVPAKGWKSPEFLQDGFPAFSSKACNALQELVTKEDTVILTSSHKAKFSIEEWKNIFRNRGLHIEQIKALPENVNNLSRKDEILNWFNNNHLDENYVIIDDDRSLSDLPYFYKKNLVLTSPFIGLTEEHSEAIKAIAQKGLQPA